MSITSLLITIAGIIVIIALYIISRVAQSKMPTKQATIIPNLKDELGEKFTSVLDDIPARDGSTTINQSKQNNIRLTEDKKGENTVEEPPLEKKSTTSKQAASTTTTSQHILFIAEKNENGLDGNLVKQALKNNGFIFGEMDIYHYMVKLENDKGMTSLFRVANGMSPWTLIDTDLDNKKLAGLSIVLLTPSNIDDEIAMKTFISVTEKLCQDIDGVLKSDKQQPLTEEDKKKLRASVKK